MDVESQSDSEEEILVYAEFEDSVNIDKYRSIHILGINGPNPIIQMDDSFFTGNYVNALGTYMFLEEDPSPQCDDPLFDKLAETNMKYVCKTRKLLKMDHAYVLPKEGQVSEETLRGEAEQLNDDVQPVHFTSAQEALNAIVPELDIKSPPPQLDEEISNQSNEPVESRQT